MGQRLSESANCCLDLNGWVLPVALEGRDFRGDLDIRIDAAGRWHYNQVPVDCAEIERLFASMLMIDAFGHYWLVTPTEMGRIEVADAPFIAIDLCRTGLGQDQCISLHTNIDSTVTLGPNTPLLIRFCSCTGESTAYVTDHRGLAIRIEHAVTNELAKYGSVHANGGEPLFGIWSAGVFFPLGQISLG